MTKGELSEDELKVVAEDRREVLENAVKGDDWKKEFRGRDLLKQFADQYTSGVRYEVLRDMIVNTMAEQEIRPRGNAAGIGKDRQSRQEANDMRMSESPREFRRPVGLSHAALHDRLNSS